MLTNSIDFRTMQQHCGRERERDLIAFYTTTFHYITHSLIKHDSFNAQEMPFYAALVVHAKQIYSFQGPH